MENLTEPPINGTETEMLLGALERQRRTLRWKVGGLDHSGLTATLEPSEITLGGLLKHLAFVEEYNLGTRMLGKPLGSPWTEGGWEQNPAWDWISASDDSPQELYQLWDDTISRCRSHIQEALLEGGLDLLAQEKLEDGTAPSLRYILTNLLEEYARHVGHADLIRESIDGLTGEDPPE